MNPITKFLDWLAKILMARHARQMNEIFKHTHSWSEEMDEQERTIIDFLEQP